MQKKLIAMAVAGLVSGAAFAQSNVTVYGVVDASQEVAKATGAASGVATDDKPNRGRLSPGGSHIGFKGSEDLGGGMKALFQIESGINTDASGGTWASRDTFVGLNGHFGTVVAGVLTHPLRQIGLKVDMTPGSTGTAFGGLIGQVSFGGLRMNTGADDRATNAVAYVSPDFSGFSGTVAYVNGEDKVNGTATTTSYNRRAYQLGLKYENGPVYVGFAHHIAKDPSADATANDEAKITRLGATYTLPSDTKLALVWDRFKFEDKPFGGTSTEAKRTAWGAGVSQGFGAHRVYAQYQKARKVTGSMCDGWTGCDDTAAKQFTVGYDYSLSKRTTLKAYYTKVSNDKGARYDFYNNGMTPSTGADPVAYGVGLRHSF